MIKLILTDDHQIVRDGIKALLKDEQKIEVVGEASDGIELIKLLDTTFADLVLLDISMPNKDGFETVQHLKSHYPNLKVLVLSMLTQESYVSKMLEAGASGYILKNVGKEELTSAIGLVASGTTYICSEIAIGLLKKNGVDPGIANGGKAEVSKEQQKSISKRELEVLTLIAEGFTNAEIADKLFTSKRTIETHRQNLLEKTQMKNTATLIKYALKQGIIS